MASKPLAMPEKRHLSVVLTYDRRFIQYTRFDTIVLFMHVLMLQFKLCTKLDLWITYPFLLNGRFSAENLNSPSIFSLEQTEPTSKLENYLSSTNWFLPPIKLIFCEGGH